MKTGATVETMLIELVDEEIPLLDEFAARAPAMPREFVTNRLEWPPDLPAYGPIENNEEEDWRRSLTEIDDHDSYEARWKKLDPITRVRLGIEWRYHYAMLMLEERRRVRAEFE